MKIIRCLAALLTLALPTVATPQVADSTPSIQEQWGQILKILPSDYPPAAIERLARAFAAIETDRRNDRAAEQYQRRILPNWRENFTNNGQYNPIPIPPFKVRLDVFLGPVGWEWIETTLSEFVTPMWEPAAAFLLRLNDAQLRAIGYQRPPGPAPGTIAVGQRLRDRRYVALPADTVPDGQVIDYDGKKLKKIVWPTPFGQPQWYVVVK